MTIFDLAPRRARKVSSQEQWTNEFDIFIGTQFEQTLGKLINALRKHATVPASLEQTLKETLSLRNFLVHRFFREHAEEFASFQGRERMLSELQNAQQQFLGAEKELAKLTKPFCRKMGFTKE